MSNGEVVFTCGICHEVSVFDAKTTGRALRVYLHGDFLICLDCEKHSRGYNGSRGVFSGVFGND